MGKASKWIRNLLIGKKEEREKKKEILFSAESVAAIFQAMPKERHRWSFGRSSSSTDTATKTTHKSTKSFDSVVTTQLVAQALLDYELENEAIKPIVTEVAIKHEPAFKSGPADAAATKIQAAFRSYLARKALCALRGLVKLQALVRGHLVRKQSTAMMRCMHALMAIQVRARVQRIQMAEERQVVFNRRTTTHKELVAQDNHLIKPYRETIDINVNETRRVLKSKSGHINNSPVERTENGYSTYYSGRLSISKKENQPQIYPNQSVSVDVTSRAYKKQFEEYSYPSAHRSSQYYADSVTHDYEFLPNYMANTESSRAKRSQSEPKQRPKWNLTQKGSKEDIQMQRSSSHLRRSAQKNQYPWLIKLYRSTKLLKDSDCDSTSTTNYSNYRKSLIAYEPPVNLY